MDSMYTRSATKHPLFGQRFLAGVDFARTTGPSTSTGTISSALEYDPNELPVVNYLPITGKVTDCDEAVKKDLSTDQLYFLKACLAVQRGRQVSTNIDFLEKSLPGNISHARWLTKANRILRLYMSKKVASEPLRRVTHFILNLYGPSWFKIKSNSSCQNGANNFFYLVQLFQELDALDQAVVRPVLENNCYFAHAENILLAAVSDSDMEIGRFSVEQIIRAREKQTNNNIPAVERTIKDVSAASCKVYGRKSRHGMVLQSKKSRLEIPKIDSKKDFINIIREDIDPDFLLSKLKNKLNDVEKTLQIANHGIYFKITLNETNIAKIDNETDAASEIGPFKNYDTLGYKMVRNYVRKSTRCSTYDGESWKKALDALTNGQLFSKVIREYGVPARTLRRHQKAMTTSPVTIKLSRLSSDLKI
ncbi:hypothetical protein HELRODRAFT_180337 [Helobdella robusta]|uniref:HTH psq-type domain-containing protein n=1 Tax=Helobdella robusta TaxID=6412 RepID=T1FFR9_HELRO|nr:hypothetical protein HELRODRAFT_180337 [Helobdella robusta]ESN93930.1 hypothetical protein HELRODRAFT_180337 [Helobdella robusta]